MSKPTLHDQIKHLEAQLSTLRELREHDINQLNSIRAQVEYHKQEVEREKAKVVDLKRQLDWHARLNFDLVAVLKAR